jgi:hypothetical protein
METLNGVAPAIAARNNRAASFAISPRDYLSLGRFSNAADKFGLKSTGITKGPFGQGALLKLSSSNHDYEVLVDGTGQMLLGRIENGQRVKLYAGSTNTKAAWDKLLEALRQSEGRLPCK